MGSCKTRKNELWIQMVVTSVLLIAIIFISVGGWVTKSHFEAKTYSRLTGRQVTTWDAMWVQLRVIEPALPSGSRAEADF